MEFPVRKHPRLKNHNYSRNGGYFITICTRDRMPLFWDGPGVLSPAGEIVLSCLKSIPEHIPGTALDICCVMPDHVHLILMVKSVGPPYMAADRSKQMASRAVQQFKAAVSRKIGVGGIWQRGFYDHILRNDADLAETRQYILNNPLKRTQDKD